MSFAKTHFSLRRRVRGRESERRLAGLMRRPVRYLVWMSLGVLFLWMLRNWIETATLLRHAYNPLPVWDYWREVQLLSRYQHFDVSALWMQHNEHRIIFPEIVFAADLLLLNGREILPLVLSFSLYLFTWVLLAAVFLSDRQLPRELRIAGVLLSGVIVGWKGCINALGSPFLLQWPMTQIAVLIAIICIAYAPQSPRRRVALTGAILAALVATYSSGNGMLVWPLLIGIGLLVSLSRRELLFLVAAAVLSVSLYFVGYHASQQLEPHAVLTHPWNFAEFVGSYLSMPFGGMKSPEFGAYLGLASLACGLALLAAVWMRFRRNPVTLVLGSYFLFAIFTSVLTACGRMEIGDPFFTNAKAARYITVSTVNWAVLLFLGLFVAGRSRWRIVSPVLLAAFVVVLLAVGFPKLRWWFVFYQDHFAEEQLTTLSVMNGIADYKLIKNIFPDPEFVLRYLPELQRDRLSVFYDDPSRFLGQPTASFSPTLPDQLEGAITYIRAVHGGFEIVGWSDQSIEPHPDQRLLFADQDGHIIGWGKRFPIGFPRDLRVRELPYSVAWAGFVAERPGLRSISAYLIAKHGLILVQKGYPLPSVGR